MTKKGKTKYPKLKDKEWMKARYLEEDLYIREIAEIIGCGCTIVQKAIGIEMIGMNSLKYLSSI